MFDLYGIVDFGERLNVQNICNPFTNYRLYDFDYNEHVIQAPHARIFCLGRGNSHQDIYEDGSLCCIILGFVFTNKNYQTRSGTQLHKLTALDVHKLFVEYGSNFVQQIKGSFVITIYDRKTNTCMLVSDQLNVLPVYYAFSNKILIFSSAIKPLLDSGLISSTIDTIALAEVAVFDYTLGTRTFYVDIARLDCGTIATVSRTGISIREYFTFDTLFRQERLAREESLELLLSMLKDNVTLHSCDSGKFLLSLTGGFDGRANLAMVNRPTGDFLCYSYGMPGSRQIRIPLAIAEQTGIQYRPILLDREFEEQYENWAMRALFYSDGTAPLIRANYPYAFNRLCEFSDIAITGLFGSEVLRPARNLGIQINKNSEELFLAPDHDETLRHILQHERTRSYLQPAMFDEAYDAIRDYFQQQYFSIDSDDDALTLFYKFYLGEGVRKYFMQEIRIERVYVTTRFPYWDVDLVAFLYRTPFAGLYNGALRQSPIGRRRAQALYAHLINKYRPDLGDIITDRGYRPRDLLSPFFYIKVLPGYIRAKYQTRYAKNDTFNSEKWTQTVFARHHRLMKKQTDIFSGSMYEKYQQGQSIRDNYYFSRMFSLKYWFEQISL